MIRSIASMPPLAGSRSSSTAPGLVLPRPPPRRSRPCRPRRRPRSRAPDSRVRRARVRARLSPTTTTTSGGASPVAGSGRAGLLTGHRHGRRAPPSALDEGVPARSASASPVRQVRVPNLRRSGPPAAPRARIAGGHAVLAAARSGPRVVRRRTPATCPGASPGTTRVGRCWSARSCCSRRRWRGWSRSTGPGWSAGRRPAALAAEPPGEAVRAVGPARLPPAGAAAARGVATEVVDPARRRAAHVVRRSARPAGRR